MLTYFSRDVQLLATGLIYAKVNSRSNPVIN
jgi:hypothetical protein